MITYKYIKLSWSNDNKKFVTFYLTSFLKITNEFGVLKKMKMYSIVYNIKSKQITSLHHYLETNLNLRQSICRHSVLQKRSLN